VKASEGSDGSVTLRFIMNKLPQQKRIVSTALTGVEWKGCDRDRTVKWNHFQKSHKLSVCGFTEKVRTTVWGHAHVGTVLQEWRTSSWSGRRITCPIF